VGGGSVALNVEGFDRLVLGDTNPGVMALWTVLRFESDAFIQLAEGMFTPKNNTEARYYAIRSAFNHKLSVNDRTWQLPADFLYLNRHCFNGLCRFNAKGEFNVPYGKYEKPYFPRVELEAAQKVAVKSEVHQKDFREIMATAKKGDVVYCDPPYIPLSETSNFTAYSKGGFGALDQLDLKNEAEAARKRGATVIISNNDVPDARKLYEFATEIHEVQVRKAISCKANGRVKSGEILAVYRP
jgi:DNA adenine methylase